MTTWLWLAGFSGFAWIARWIGLEAARRTRIALRRDSYSGELADPPRVSVIVAAKDEDDCIQCCLESLLTQDYPNFEVIVVDDRSTDDTPAILSRLAREWNGKLNVLTVAALSDGWFGKNNAMREGVEASEGEWLLFTDADCRQTSKSSITIAMHDAVATGTDFLSIMPRLVMQEAWEKVLQPVCAIVLIFWFMPRRVNDPKKPTAYANGAFMLLRRKCYDAIGGHAGVRTEVNEDVHLARLAKSSGHRLRVVENEDLYCVRMYRTPGEALRGWSRIFYGCIGTLPRLLLVATSLLVFSLMPWVSLSVAVAGWLMSQGAASAGWLPAVGAWTAVVLLEQIVAARLFGIFRISRLWSLTYPLGAATTFCIVMSAMLKRLGATTTTWRGTTYRGHHLVPSATDSPLPVARAPSRVEPVGENASHAG